MALDPVTSAALEVGRRRAKEILKFRARALKRRTRALQTRARAARATAAALGAAATAGVLVAEGDSWFDYPLHDVLEMLEDDHGYDVESVAHRGDPIEEMAYGGNQLEEFTRRIEKLLRRNVVPKAILLSGGGNDVAGKEFGMLLNHAQSAVAGLNAQVVAGVVDERIQTAYITILSAVTSICEEKIGKALPILVHGYDYPVPDGRGFLGGWWVLPGPWLEPGFREKGFEDLDQRKALAQELIDRFNTMLLRVAGLQPFAHVKYIDLRNTLPRDRRYKDWWANELHPTEKGFARVTDKFVAELNALP
jgi:GDSL-like lipase/acylhydrolase family protein